MTDRSASLSRRELYTGSMVVFIGLFYFLTETSGWFTPAGTFVWQDIKLGVLSVVYFFAGWLYLRKRKAGWILSAGILMNFVMVISVFIFRLAGERSFDFFSALSFFVFVLLLVAFLFLFGRNTRKKYFVNNKSYLLTLLVYLVMITANFLI